MILNLQTSLIMKKTKATISDKSLGLYDLNKKLTVARQRGHIFNQEKTNKKIL